MANYPPYVNAYGGIAKLFEEIRKASVPPKFTQDFLNTILGLKSSSYRAMIPFLKRLGFIDQSNVPTQAYKDFRDESISRTVMTQKIKEAYSELYAANEYAHKLTKEQLSSKLKTIIGVAENDKVIPFVANCFMELCKLADFEDKHKPTIQKKTVDGEEVTKTTPKQLEQTSISKLGISYTINLNLPATTEIEVFNAIFKSLKEHILSEK